MSENLLTQEREVTDMTQKKTNFKTRKSIGSFAFIESMEITNLFKNEFGNKSYEKLNTVQFEKALHASLFYHLSIITQEVIQEFLKIKFEKAEQEFKIFTNKLNHNKSGVLKSNPKGYREWLNFRYLPLFDQSELFKIFYTDFKKSPELAIKKMTPQLIDIFDSFGKSKLKSKLRKMLKRSMFNNFTVVNYYYKKKFGADYIKYLTRLYELFINTNMEFAAIFLEIKSLRKGAGYSTENFDIALFIKRIHKSNNRAFKKDLIPPTKR